MFIIAHDNGCGKTYIVPFGVELGDDDHAFILELNFIEPVVFKTVTEAQIYMSQVLGWTDLTHVVLVTTVDAQG